MKRILMLGALLALTACGTTGPGDFGQDPPLPQSGPIAYTCSDGTQLAVTFEENEARVAVVGGRSMVLPNTGTGEAPYYYNGRYGLRGRGASATWQAGGAPVTCRGS